MGRAAVQRDNGGWPLALRFRLQSGPLLQKHVHTSCRLAPREPMALLELSHVSSAATAACFIVSGAYPFLQLTHLQGPCPLHLFEANSIPLDGSGYPSTPDMKTALRTTAATRAVLGNYEEMRNNYLSMLSSSQDVSAQEESRERPALTSSPRLDPFPDDNPYAGEPLFDPNAELSSSRLYDFSPNNPHASPFDTPYSAFIPTPSMGMEGDEFGSPVISRGSEGSRALFAFTEDGEDAVPVDAELPSPPSPDTNANAKLGMHTPTTPVLDDFDSPLTTLSTSFPTTPISPVSREPSPSGSPPALATPSRRQSSRHKPRVVHDANGTRKNITPASLIPLDAPTQHRTYRLPSSTSRKAVPASSRKRVRNVAFADNVNAGDTDDGEPAADAGGASRTRVSANEAQRILDKRRQNTLAARKSRRRKLEHVQGLEREVDELKGLVERWKERAIMVQGMLKQKGTVLEFEED
uniref:BZIP domain-containing protein n=1 Tax=Mycena chlorophos TaxID=658473 RepID=A0ABQ0MCW5_MYCCL|nr:predicted protein [Mycena chlorophos]